MRPRVGKDVLSGLIFVGFGIAFGVIATGYQIGTAFRMGPGYFPLALAVVLALLGAVIVAKGLAAGPEDGPPTPIPWRGAVMTLAALIFFGAAVVGLGLGPALFVTAFVAALASRSNGPRAAALLALALTLLCLVIFVRGLGVPLPVLGPWVRF